MTRTGDASTWAVVRRLARGVSGYTLALVLAGAARMLAIPFVVRSVPPRTYGAYSALSVVVWALCATGDLGLGAAALRLAPETKTDAERRTLFSTMISARAAAVLVLTAGVVVFAGPITRWTTGDITGTRALVWLAPFASFAMLLEGLSDELRSRGEMRGVSLLVVLTAVLIQGLTLLFVVGGGLSLLGLVWARVLGEAFACGAAFFLCWRYIRARPSIRELLRLLTFGWPIGVMMGLAALHGLDRPMIRSLSSLDAVGAYELALRLVGPIGLVNIALVKVLEPFVYGNAGSKSLASHTELGMRVYVAVFATVAMTLSAIGPELVAFLAPGSYGEASRALPSLAFMATCEMVLRISGLGADVVKRTRVWAVTTVVTVVVALPLMAMLLPRLGLAGAGLAWVAGNAVAAILIHRVARQLSGIVLPVLESLGIIVGGALVGTAIAWQPSPLSTRLVVLVAFALLAFVTLQVRKSTVLSSLGGEAGSAHAPIE